jgi:hypothetical protein
VRGTLTSGAASFHVEHLGPGQRFLLALPDGDLEVRGTRFTVRAHDGATEEVVVTEGVVALHIRDHGEIVLRAGERWPRGDAATPSPSMASPLPSASDAVQSAPVATAARPAAKQPEATQPAATQPAASTSRASADAERKTFVASERFVAAMTVFNAGSYARADALLGSFMTDFPSDPRREDALFLSAVARDRMGDHAAAAARAREYVRAYPAGLRQREARKLAGEPPP